MKLKLKYAALVPFLAFFGLSVIAFLAFKAYKDSRQTGDSFFRQFFYLLRSVFNLTSWK